MRQLDYALVSLRMIPVSWGERASGGVRLVSAKTLFKGRFTLTRALRERWPSGKRRMSCRTGIGSLASPQPGSWLLQLCRTSLPKIDRSWLRFIMHLPPDLIPCIFLSVAELRNGKTSARVGLLIIDGDRRHDVRRRLTRAPYKTIVMTL